MLGMRPSCVTGRQSCRSAPRRFASRVTVSPFEADFPTAAVSCSGVSCAWVSCAGVSCAGVSVRTFCTGSRPRLRRGGVGPRDGAPRCGRRWRAVLAHPTAPHVHAEGQRPGPVLGRCSQLRRPSPSTALMTAGAGVSLASASPSPHHGHESRPQTRLDGLRTRIAAGHPRADSGMIGAQTRVVATLDFANGFANTDSENDGQHRTGLPSAEHESGPTKARQTPSELLKIGRSAVRPRPWPPPHKAAGRSSATCGFAIPEKPHPRRSARLR